MARQLQLIAAVQKCRQSWEWVGDENDYSLEEPLDEKLRIGAA